MGEHKSARQLFKFNFWPIVLFEIMYRLVSFVFLIPLSYAMLNLSVKLAGIECLNRGTLTKYLNKPTTHILFLVIIFVFALYILINISGIMYAMECSRKNEKTNPLSMFLRGMVNSLRVFRPANIGILIYVLFVLPFTYTVMISGSLLGIRIPDFFSRFIIRNKYIAFALLIIYIFFCATSIVKIYSLNYFFLYKVNYKQAKKLSEKTIKNKVIKTFVEISFLSIFFTVCLIGLETGLVAVTAGVLKTLITSKKLFFVLNSITKIIIFIVYIGVSIISTPFVYAVICSKFYKNEAKTNYENIELKPERRKFRRKELTKEQLKKRNHIMGALLIIISILVNFVYIMLVKFDVVSINIAYSTKASVTAHRGDSKNAPENTMAAFQVALDNQADIIEIDVRQTGDGKYIVLHDENLHRTTNVDAKVGLLSYDFIKNIDAGVKFSEEYKGEPIPLLEEVLLFADLNDIMLNIELKPAKTDNNYVEGIVQMLEEYDFVDKCVVASTDPKLLKKVKALNENIQTVYIMHMALGKFGNMNYVDIFSIRYNFISDSMVKDIHKNGKKVYAWTVNSESEIKELLLMDVDSIITDDPYKTKTIIYNANDSLLSDWLQRLMKNY